MTVTKLTKTPNGEEITNKINEIIDNLGSSSGPSNISQITTLNSGSISLTSGALVYKHTVSANTTYSFSTSNLNITSSDEFSFKLYIDLRGTTYTLTFPNNVKWSVFPFVYSSSKNIPFFNEKGLYLLEFKTIDAGVSWIGKLYGIWQEEESS